MHTQVSGDLFKCWVPFDVVEKAGEKDTKLGRISGIVSSESPDADDDIIVQDGIDWSLFKARGYVVHEHPFGVKRMVGEPLKIEQTEVDGVQVTRLDAGLYLHDPDGKMLFEKSRMLKKSSDTRRLGYSIEGGILEREKKDRRRVARSKVHTVAITAFPKNDQSWFEPLAASLLASLQGLDPLLRAETIGYPAQGEAAVGAGGIAKLAPQSLQGAKGGGRLASKTYSMSVRDMVTATLLKQLPQWSWAQGVAVADELIKRLNNRKEKVR